MQRILHNGANVNLYHGTGDHYLYVACQKGHNCVIQFLLDNGADVNLCNNEGLNLLSIACENGN